MLKMETRTAREARALCRAPLCMMHTFEVDVVWSQKAVDSRFQRLNDQPDQQFMQPQNCMDCGVPGNAAMQVRPAQSARVCVCRSRIPKGCQAAMASAHALHASQPTHFVFLSSYGDGARRWKSDARMYLDAPDWFLARLSEHSLQHLLRQGKSHTSEKDHAVGFAPECVALVRFGEAYQGHVFVTRCRRVIWSFQKFN